MTYREYLDPDFSEDDYLLALLDKGNLSHRINAFNRGKSKAKGRFSCNIRVMLCACLCAVMLCVAAVVVAVPILAAVVGTVSYRLAFWTTAKNSFCGEFTHHVNPANFSQTMPCHLYQEMSHALLPRYFIEQEDSEGNVLWQKVTFPARMDHHGHQPVITAYAYEQVGDGLHTRPWIIVTHGYKVCKEIYISAMASSMLYRGGYNVLSIDLRNHGHSEADVTPYVTFGSIEHYDVLGALDYLLATYPRLNDTNCETCRQQVGLYGFSMGGATSTIAFARDKGHYLNTMFLDSPVVNVLNTLRHNIDATAAFPVSWALLPLLQLFGSYLLNPRNGAPPFAFDPANVLKEQISDSSGIERHVWIDQSLRDDIVPHWNANYGKELMHQAGINVTIYIADSGQEYIDRSIHCDDHMTLILSETAAYEHRLVEFFNDHLHDYNDG